LNALGEGVPVPDGVSKLYVLFALAKHARDLGAFKLARYAFDKLQQLRVPHAWMDQIDLATITIRSKPFSDKEVSLQHPTTLSTHSLFIGTAADLLSMFSGESADSYKGQQLQQL
jgi:intraflagellar transport protein 122